jgi:hypothetical protein
MDRNGNIEVALLLFFFAFSLVYFGNMMCILSDFRFHIT